MWDTREDIFTYFEIYIFLRIILKNVKHVYIIDIVIVID